MHFIPTDDPLRRADFDTGTWARLRLLLTARLHKLREENDAPADQDRTAMRRGRIAEVKELLALEDEIRQPPHGDAAL